MSEAVWLKFKPYVQEVTINWGLVSTIFYQILIIHINHSWLKNLINVSVTCPTLWQCITQFDSSDLFKQSDTSQWQYVVHYSGAELQLRFVNAHDLSALQLLATQFIRLPGALISAKKKRWMNGRCWFSCLIIEFCTVICHSSLPYSNVCSGVIVRFLMNYLVL